MLTYFDKVFVFIQFLLFVVFALLSPIQTTMLTPRPLDLSKEGFKDWPFTSVQAWGEDPKVRLHCLYSSRTEIGIEES